MLLLLLLLSYRRNTHHRDNFQLLIQLPKDKSTGTFNKIQRLSWSCRRSLLKGNMCKSPKMSTKFKMVELPVGFMSPRDFFFWVSMQQTCPEFLTFGAKKSNRLRFRRSHKICVHFQQNYVQSFMSVFFLACWFIWIRRRRRRRRRRFKHKINLQATEQWWALIKKAVIQNLRFKKWQKPKGYKPTMGREHEKQDWRRDADRNRRRMTNRSEQVNWKTQD